MTQPKSKFFDQPRGVMLIAATEFWERFSYYGFVGLVTLFMAADPATGGLGMGYRYVIELGRTLEPLPEEEHSAANKVQGCVSQVWLSKRVDRSQSEPRIVYRGDSDAHIVRGLVAIVLALYSGRTPKQILDTDALAVFEEFGFREHLTPQRSNGLRSMVERIKTDAREALAAAS